MKKIKHILILSIITCLSSPAKDFSDDSIRMSVPDVLVIKMLLFREMISTEIPETDKLNWPDASAKLTADEIRLAKSILDGNHQKNIFFKIKKVEYSDKGKTNYWLTTYSAFDKNSQKATGGHVSAIWYKSPSLSWYLVEVGNANSVNVTNPK